MADEEKHVLDLTGTGIKKLEKRDGIGIKKLVLDNNELTKIENLDFFPDVEKLSASGNNLVRMYGVSKLNHLTHLDLSNNSIICIEGVKELTQLSIFILSVNNIKSIQNLQNSVNLTVLDLSKNNISTLVDISYLSKLKTLHLNGNKISSLRHSSTYLPSSLCSLSLAENCITDLNETGGILQHVEYEVAFSLLAVRFYSPQIKLDIALLKISYLCGLHCLEHLTVSGNPCVMITGQLPIFDYRPFVINWSLGLRLLDGYVVTQKESLKAEWLYSQGRGRHFKIGEHAELVEYLSQACPLTSEKLIGEEDEKLSRILQMQRQHREQFLHELSQVFQPQSVVVTPEPSKMTHSYHSKIENSHLNDSKGTEMSRSPQPSRIMYESAPEVLFHCDEKESSKRASPSLNPDSCPLSTQTETSHHPAKSPITIEQVVVDIDVTKNKTKDISKTPYQYYEDRIVRPAPTGDMNIYSRADISIHSKGTPVRKVSKRATSPCTLSPSPGRAKTAHSPSVRSKLSPSRSCTLQERHQSKLSGGKNSSESDTSEEHSQSAKAAARNFKQTLSPNISSRNSSPLSRQKFSAESSPMKRSLCLNHTGKVDNKEINRTFTSSPAHKPALSSQAVKIQTMAEKYNKNAVDLHKAATKIQSVWRGHHTRHHNYRVFKLRQEIRFRRMEDHIQHLHKHLCRLTDFVLRQQQDLQHERELRKMQAEDITSLYEKAKELQKNVSVILSKRNSEQKCSELQNSEQESFEVSRDGLKDADKKSSFPKNALVLASKFEKALQNQRPDFLTSSLQYSTQSFQENSGLFSPSSQTSSVVSSVPDTAFPEIRSSQEVPPSTSDTSEADSGLQSMVSSSFSAFLDNEKSTVLQESDSSTMYNINNNHIDNVNLFTFKEGGEKINANNENNCDPTTLVLGISHSYLQASNPIYAKNAKDILFHEQQQHGDCGSESVLQNRLNFYKNRNDITPSGNALQRNTILATEMHSCINSQGNGTPKNGYVNLYENDTPCSPEGCSSHSVSASSEVASKCSNAVSEPFLFTSPFNGPLQKNKEVESSVTAESACKQSQNKQIVIPTDVQIEKTNLSESSNSQKSNPNESAQQPSSHLENSQANVSQVNSSCQNGECTSGTTFCSNIPNQHSSKAFCKAENTLEADKQQIHSHSNIYPWHSNKGLNFGSKSKPSTPHEETKSIDSPQSPCTVEMSGRISHSCSFQSDGFTAAEELSATATVKLVSTRAVSMTCTNGPLSPQSASQRPLPSSESSPQTAVRSPLALAASVWEKKVQDIEATFHQLQSQIRDLEGAFGQFGQFGQFFYPAVFPDDSKESRHVLHHIDPTAGALVLDMPKINFKRTGNGSNDLFLQRHFSGQLGTGIPFLPPSSQYGSAEKQEFCCVEELEQEPPPDKAKNVEPSCKATDNANIEN